MLLFEVLKRNFTFFYSLYIYGKDLAAPFSIHTFIYTETHHKKMIFFFSFDNYLTARPLNTLNVSTPDEQCLEVNPKYPSRSPAVFRG